MAKNNGPYFEFRARRDEQTGKIKGFTFLPGNFSPAVYNQVNQTLIKAFSYYGGGFATTEKLEAGGEQLTISVAKTFQVIKSLVSSRVYKIKITKFNKLNEEETIDINSYIELPKAAKFIESLTSKNVDSIKNQESNTQMRR